MGEISFPNVVYSMGERGNFRAQWRSEAGDSKFAFDFLYGDASGFGGVSSAT